MGYMMGVSKNKKDLTSEKWWCGAIKEEGSTNLVDDGYTQTQQPPKQIGNIDKDLGVAYIGATYIYLLPTPRNENDRPHTRTITFGTSGGPTLTNSDYCTILVNSIPK